MTSTTQGSAAEAIVAEVGGPENIISVSHCATRLRFDLKDATKVNEKALDKVPEVLGVVPQSGDRYQVVIGGAVETTYSQIMNLPSMKTVSSGKVSDSDVKAAERAKTRGKFAWLDSFFEYLSNSFRPLLGVLLGASLVIAGAAVLDAFGIVPFRNSATYTKAASWVFIDSIWHAVFFFLPIMVAYNAAKALKIDPWVGATIMGALMTPEFVSLSANKYVETAAGSGLYKQVQGFATTVCTPSPIPQADPSCVAHIFGIPMQLAGYSGQVFVPLIMVAVLALVYRFLKKVFPENVQMVFVPFLSMLIMVPVTAFIIGPLGIWLGTTIGTGLAFLNGHAPILFAIIIPLIYPFLVPLGLHWPLNALMLANIASASTGHMDFIQGPMGSWNFACFGATAGVLFISIRDKEVEMRQTATGALAAGLLGGISEPSLYGIHLRYKRIYPRMLVGCLVGGLITGLGGGVKTGIFAFTSLLTIPVFSPMALYAISIAAAFATAMILVIISDYRTPEQKAEAAADRAQAEADLALETGRHAKAAGRHAKAAPAASVAAVAGVDAVSGGGGVATLVATTDIATAVAGKVISLDDVPDKVFASRALGEGVGIVPTDGTIVAPVSGVLATVAATGHAYGIKTDDGVEVLIHVGIDTVRLKGEGFTVLVTKGERVTRGEVLGTVDLEVVKAAGFDPTTMVVVTNTKNLTTVTPRTGEDVVVGDSVIDITR
jgi:PTS system beta-glucosides-specific IIC component